MAQLDTQNPILYLDFAEGRVKLRGTMLFPKNKYLAIRFGQNQALCEDVFESMVHTQLSILLRIPCSTSTLGCLLHNSSTKLQLHDLGRLIITAAVFERLEWLCRSYFRSTAGLARGRTTQRRFPSPCQRHCKGLNQVASLNFRHVLSDHQTFCKFLVSHSPSEKAY